MTEIVSFELKKSVVFRILYSNYVIYDVLYLTYMKSNWNTLHVCTLAFLAVSAISVICFENNGINKLIFANAQGIISKVTANYSNIPSAESVHTTETLKLPANINTFVMLVANEAHESWKEEQHKLITDKNAYFIPTNLIIYEGTKLVLLDADAPWDTPHPHQLELVNVNNEENNNVSSLSTGILDYTNNSKPFTLPVGNYSITDRDYEIKEGTVTVLENNQGNNNNNGSISELIVGGFYTPTNQVENTKDNDGNSHPGSLAYYRQVFHEQGIKILSEYNFNYSKCDYCPDGYWPDNKSGDHTLIIFGSEKPLEQTLEILKSFVKDNVYI